MKRCLFAVLAVLLSLVVVFQVSAGGQGESAANKPTEFKLGFMTSLSGAFAVLAETQRKGTELAVAEVNDRGGLKMPWGKVPVKLIVKDDEAKLDVGMRRYRELVEAGINGFWPLECAAGNDAVALRKQYGRDIILAGNIDKRAFLKGEDVLRSEVMAKVPHLLQTGGYFPSLDHLVPPDVPFTMYREFINLMRDVAGLERISL